MKRIAALTLAAAMVLGGCAQDASKADLAEPQQKGRSIPDEYEVRVPDALTVFQNIDGHPTLTRVCIDGVAFLTTSRDFSAVTRLPEWDDACPKAAK